MIQMEKQTLSTLITQLLDKQFDLDLPRPISLKLLQQLPIAAEMVIGINIVNTVPSSDSCCTLKNELFCAT